MATAKQTYSTNYENAHHKLSEILLAMLAHFTNADKDGLNWSHIGDLAHVNEQLDEALAFLRGEDD